MFYVDSEDQLNDYFLDPNRRIPKAHLQSVCKFRQEGCCRYISRIIIGDGPYVCMKKSPAKEQIDGWAKTDGFSAKADNCEGLGDENEKS